MTLNLSLPGQEDLKPRITVFGVGGAGGNAVNNMIQKELDGVDFVVANTDAQALQQSMAQSRIQMGVKVTEGLGAGARATVGAAAAEESIEQIVDHLAGAHMCFITAGMGGGTGTGAAPIIAQAARELGVLTVGVVTKPFQFEGGKRMKQAEEGVDALQKVVDTLIIIPNQNLFRLANENTTFTDAFAMADDVLYQGVKGVTDLMVRPGLINLDFADVRAVMDEMGKAMMGTGEAEGENRAVQAAEKAIANPLLDEISLEGAKGVLINITGGHDLTLFELDEAANKIREKVDPDANIIVGSTLDPSMEGAMRVSVVATGIDAAVKSSDMPVPRRSMSQPLRERVSQEDTRQTEVAAAPAPRPTPVPAPEPVAAQAVEQEHHMEEPTLFDAPAAQSEEEDDFADIHSALVEDELPPPAYQPRAEPAMDSAESFIAPRAPAPGTPSPEALARLRSAVQSQPRAAEPRPAAPQHAAETERPRFGIGSLINRMSGQHGEAPRPTREQPQVSSQPAAQRHDEEDAYDPDQERIEIPAFLRRQAN
ncbi:cell division protein FtsZ [Ponticoccus sp. SC2-23]|uniref:cell division protein FtsZ n=1 Tax=Alexandriicola marinus TaxID=2081710 RepID=UPI000FD7A274|nr:cell division protein FtsZ [Alexandriicola marinus]MBM1219478.1 cell division protein FtsZ [Ponticoccus sp. SC6-9]MBM1223450.1 cell division protein FtsZ [Ponticoccus sp. SC6-15]MBM1229291.1 cell division protein FtsZ [Ponticoccus sp. SC6-38]MBM1232416.1 cell division protein FtsZ [Ponticoccus sp. SC6-45]MBM1237634.1 cell division protein FtsZ [Ponticoccus sp. SC6-49]MBM1241427.1 cell division protein FtsZ [Ponticoccus sp. SC2-64]MBM1245940.1 cell division protein FtsZ [Ponticoccus sp. SC